MSNPEVTASFTARVTNKRDANRQNPFSLGNRRGLAPGTSRLHRCSDSLVSREPRRLIERQVTVLEH